MAPCLSKLPSVCLEAIFSHVPLVDLLHSVGLVCTTWFKSRRTELMRRKRLVIVQRRARLENLNHDMLYCSYGTDLIRHVRRDDGSPWFTLESPDQIKFDGIALPNDIVDMPLICSLLPNITHLTLMFDETHLSNSALNQMILFIEHYSQHLVDLKLCIGSLPFGDTDFAVEFVNILFSCLNRLQSLRHLRLDLSLFRYNLRIRPQMTFLTRLTTFAVNVYGIEDAIGWILFSLRQYGPNIDSIELYNYVKLPNLLSLDHQLDTKINGLSFNGIGIDDYDDMKRFCSRFSSLTRLTLVELSMSMTMLARCLSLLPHLVKLSLNFRHLPQVEEPPDGEQSQPIAQVHSVRLLILDIQTGSHLDSEKLFIPEIFPHLQVLRLSQHCIRCSVCKIMHLTPPQFLQTSNPERVRKVAECKRLTRQSFRRCVNLHTIALPGPHETSLINIDEL